MSLDLLPVEIVAAIFIAGLSPYDHAVDPWADESYPVRQRYLSSICSTSHRCREVAYATPLLWTLVVLRREPHRLPATRIVNQLQRAATSLVDVICTELTDNEEEQPISGVWALWTIVRARSNRWRTLVVGSSRWGYSGSPLDDFIPFNLPELRIAELQGFPETLLTGNQCVITAPQLCKYVPTHPPFFPFIPTPSMVYLLISEWDHPTFFFVSRFTGLETLVLRISRDELGDNMEPMTDIPSLRNLELISCDTRFSKNILRKLPASNLETIYVADARYPYDFLYDATPTLFPALSILRVKGIELKCIEGILRSLRNVNTVTVEADFRDFPATPSSSKTRFNNLDLGIRLVERMCSIRWVNEGNLNDPCFKTWAEVRAHFTPRPA